MTKDQVLEALRDYAQGFVKGSSTRVAYENAIALVEKIGDNIAG